MTTITWKIEELEWINRVAGSAKVVSTVKGKCEAMQDDHTCWLPFTANLTLPESESFVAYDSLTETQVLNWAKAALGADKVSSIESTVTNLVTEDLEGGNSVKHNSAPPWG